MSSVKEAPALPRPAAPSLHWARVLSWKLGHRVWSLMAFTRLRAPSPDRFSSLPGAVEYGL